MTKNELKLVRVGEAVEFEGNAGMVVARSARRLMVQFGNDAPEAFEGGVLSDLRILGRVGGASFVSETAALEMVEEVGPALADEIGSLAASAVIEGLGPNPIVEHFAAGGSVDELASKLAAAAEEAQATDTEPVWGRVALMSDGELFVAQNGGLHCYVRVAFKSPKAAPTFAHRIVDVTAATSVSEQDGWIAQSGVSAKNGWTMNPEFKGTAWIEALRPKAAQA